MIRRALAGTALILALVALAPAARADVVSDLVARTGQKIDLAANPALKKELVDAAIVSKDATELTVDSQTLSRAFAYNRFRNQVDATRYHVGERILVEQPGSGGRFSPRAEITAVNPDGTYQVKVWDKVDAVDHPYVTGSGYVRVFSGKQPAGEDKTTVKIKNADGTTTTKDVESPWLLGQNERTITLTHDQIDALNGRTSLSKGPVTINGYSVDPANDWVLKERIAQANEIADEIFKPGSLALPMDPAGRKKALDKISKLQEKFLDEVFKANYMEHPGNDSDPKSDEFKAEYPDLAKTASERMREVSQAHPELAGKVGQLLLAKYGVCTQQAAAIAAIVEAVGSRIGLTIRPLTGGTIDTNTGHGFDMIRFANGVLGMYDVTWHFIDEAESVHAVDNLDFATFDKRPDSNRKIDSVVQPTTDKTAFVDRTSDKALELSRGYDRTGAEAYLGAATAEHAKASGISFEDAAAAILAGKTKYERVGGDFSAAVLAGRARAIDNPTATAGFLSGLDRATSSIVNDRIRDAVDANRAATDGR